jgi:beta-glucosidase
MSLEELASLACGTGWGVSNEHSPVVGSHSSTVPGAAGETTHDLWEKYGVPSMVMADGPAGIRVKQEFTEKHVITGEEIIRHQYCTAWPVGVLLAQSFDEDLLFQVGQGMAREAQEIGVTMILGPGMNIQRDPLCGRNFEYYAEDPLVSGLMAAAMTRGIQSIPGVGACLKHFAANNQETNRDAVNALLHERTLREIYLKGFEIAVKKANPMAIMTSYNLINGVPTADSYDLNMNLARGEWGFQGLIMTDWNGGQSTPAISMHAGNDLIMPGGVNSIANIIRGAKMIPPSFDDRGQIGLRKEWFFGDVYDAMWNSFIIDSETEESIEAVLGKGNVATLQGETILVNGEPVYFYACHHSRDPDKEAVVLTTRIARIDDQGNKILYRGKMAQPVICRGDVQRSAKHILTVLMQSLAMQRAYPNELISLWGTTK